MTPKPPPQVRDVARVLGGGLLPVRRATGRRAGPGAGRRLASRLRMVAARSLRCCGERGLNDPGILILSITSAGTGKSATASRLTWRPSVRTSGPGPVNSGRPPLPAAPDEPGLVLAPAVVAPDRRGAAARAIGRAAVAVAASGGMQAGLEDHREAGPAASRHPDDVARTQLRQGSRRLGPAGARPGPGQIPLAFGQRPPQLRILGEVTLIAAHRRGQLVHGLAVLADLPGQPDDAAVGLELGERGLEQVAARARPAQPVRLTAML